MESSTNERDEHNEFERLGRLVGFTGEDAEHVVRAGGCLAPVFPSVVDAFYERIGDSPMMRAVFEDDAQIERQKRALLIWLGEVFTGPYDTEYVERHAHVGRVHHRIGLEQPYMIGMMNLLRVELIDALESCVEAVELVPTTRAIERILDLELIIMLDTFREASQERVRAAERLATLGQVAAGIGHDLRNPIAVIVSSAELLKRRAGRGELDDKALKHVERIASHVELCEQIISGIMDLARNRPVDLQRGSLGDFVSSVVADYGDAVELVETCEDDEVRIDKRLFRQVIVNVVDNAIGVGATRVSLRIERQRRMLHLMVDDDGPGIPLRVLARLFEPLVSARPGGTGLGLALCHRIVSEHGGQISGRNLDGGGARFEVVLPGL